MYMNAPSPSTTTRRAPTTTPRNELPPPLLSAIALAPVSNAPRRTRGTTTAVASCRSTWHRNYLLRGTLAERAEPGGRSLLCRPDDALHELDVRQRDLAGLERRVE